MENLSSSRKKSQTYLIVEVGTKSRPPYFFSWKNMTYHFIFWCYKPAKYGLICVVKMSENGWRHLAHKWSFKALSLLEACFDLISGSSLHMKIQIMSEKITENLGFKYPLRKVKIFVLFPFPFQILHKKLYIFVFNLFWISCFTNHISIKTKIFNKFYLISN